MSDEAKRGTWWQTLPGMLTGAAALVTALAGLLAALSQTGWFAKQAPPAAAATSAAPAPGTAKAAATAGAAEHVAVTSEAPRPHAVALPAQRDYTLGPAVFKATFTLLKAEVVPQTADRSALRIRLRMTNHDRNDKNFWDQSFRLLVDDVPIAPESGLNELVAGEAAKEGEVVFPIARSTRSARLRITYYDVATEIPRRRSRTGPRRSYCAGPVPRASAPWRTRRCSADW